MLLLKPGCECCDINLPPDSDGAFICSFECTFCYQCSSEKLNFVCPDCRGELVRRPVREPELLKKYPASRQRVVKQDGCV